MGLKKRVDESRDKTRENIQRATEKQIALTIVVAIVFLGFALNSAYHIRTSDNTQPERTVNAFLKALSAKDLTEIQKLSDPTFYQEQREKLRQLTEEADLTFGDPSNQLKYVTLNEKDRAKVKVFDGVYVYAPEGGQEVVTLFDNDFFTLVFELQQIYGEWKIEDFNIEDLFR